MQAKDARARWQAEQLQRVGRALHDAAKSMRMRAMPESPFGLTDEGFEGYRGITLAEAVRYRNIERVDLSDACLLYTSSWISPAAIQARLCGCNGCAYGAVIWNRSSVTKSSAVLTATTACIWPNNSPKIPTPRPSTSPRSAWCCSCLLYTSSRCSSIRGLLDEHNQETEAWPSTAP